LQDAAFRRRLGTYIAAGAVGLALFLPRAAYDKYVVHDPANAMYNSVTTAEIYASDRFKPSQIAASKGFWGLQMRGRGISYPTLLFASPHWLWLSFQSTVGVYGYMGIFSISEYYVAAALIYLAFLASLVHAARQSASGNARASLAVAAVYAALTVLVSSLFSWSVDYQAQGRYLFPAFAMFGVVLTDLKHQRPPAAGCAAAVAFVFAAYAFYNVGLAAILKA
jgi:hypothetical protein